MSPFFEIGQIVTILFFLCFIIFFPLLGITEKLMYHLYTEDPNNSTHVYGNCFFNFKIILNLYKEKIILIVKAIFNFYIYSLIFA
jgi:hypothetical protein